ncbi:hypothetical protein NEUTE1DRAFT_116149 [Neurospora tetrasperma FGSC 2508]|uniref:Uncharacterized protein n=1 Tax=Neurospora tetrasperma (strain FGSC 2508 / ATCC MYA-4615 / P0657) TaxID=510951 RepID=F8ME15_NEUT8|nr:uncharacterized protein NEUTE1DRAFT_116149 [Neurospora tetrasperma FGSC 2508]EGO61550.1 hypothetical protein NEUTE1DRAFT_116149 [Neurospora tetrasperma FGSC 2508]EGZ74411.1 hypothetical protein NEUTE2DRAFT_143335 [Neurospora tetrasperma FGSC 2509]
MAMAMAMAMTMDRVALLDRLSSCAWHDRSLHLTKTRHLELPLAFRCQFFRGV